MGCTARSLPGNLQPDVVVPMAAACAFCGKPVWLAANDNMTMAAVACIAVLFLFGQRNLSDWGTSLDFSPEFSGRVPPVLILCVAVVMVDPRWHLSRWHWVQKE